MADGSEVDAEAVLQELQEKQSPTESPKQLRGIEDVSNMGITFGTPREITIDEQVELMQKIYEEAVKSDDMFDGLNEALRSGEDQ